jgi:hypothetical protein
MRLVVTSSRIWAKENDRSTQACHLFISSNNWCRTWNLIKENELGRKLFHGISATAHGRTNPQPKMDSEKEIKELIGRVSIQDRKRSCCSRRRSTGKWACCDDTHWCNRNHWTSKRYRRWRLCGVHESNDDPGHMQKAAKIVQHPEWNATKGEVRMSPSGQQTLTENEKTKTRKSQYVDRNKTQTFNLIWASLPRYSIISMCMETNMPGIWQAKPSDIPDITSYVLDMWTHRRNVRDHEISSKVPAQTTSQGRKQYGDPLIIIWWS